MQSSLNWMAGAFALLLLAGSTAAVSAQTEEQDHEAHHPDGAQATEATPVPQTDPGEERSGRDGMGLQGQGMMGSGMMGTGSGMTGRGGMMRAMFAVMDADGDSALSRNEVQEAHGRIFNHMDADGDGQVTLEEMQAFMAGAPMPARQMPMRGATQMDHALSESAQAYMDAMQTMMEGMEVMEMRGEPNADFALMMIPHHQSAIDMAEAYLKYGDDPDLTKLANEIIAAQQREIEFLKDWLGESR